MENDRYELRGGCTGSLLAAVGAALLIAGLHLIMTLEGWRLALALLPLMASGVVLLLAWLCARSADIVDAEGVRIRRGSGDWQRMGWDEVVRIEKEWIRQPRSASQSVMLVLTARDGRQLRIVQNEQITQLIRRYHGGEILPAKEHGEELDHEA